MTIPADEVDNWCRPSAIERARFARSFDRVAYDLRREVERVLLAEAARRDAADRAVALGASEAGLIEAGMAATWDAAQAGVADPAGGRQPVDIEQKKTPASAVPTPAAPTPTE